jgi:Fe2+ transport system protein FeoA
MTCAMCGLAFDASAPTACASCPLGSGCTLSCCPGCGYSAPDPERSAVLRLARRLRQTRRRVETRVELADGVTERQRDRLHAYGLTSGRVVEVLQTRPVTVVRVDHVEVALEPELATAIGVGR